jgi:phosphomannomutase
LRLRLPKTYATPELRIECNDTRKFKVIEEVKARLKQKGAQINDIDGVRVTTPEGWWLLRASNTQAALVARCESSSEQGLASLVAQVHKELKERDGAA